MCAIGLRDPPKGFEKMCFDEKMLYKISSSVVCRVDWTGGKKREGWKKTCRSFCSGPGGRCDEHLGSDGSYGTFAKLACLGGTGIRDMLF